MSSRAAGSAGTTGASVLRAGGWNVASLLLPQIYLVVMSIVAARYLGPSDMGRQSFIAFVALGLTLVLTGGVPYALMRFVGELVGRGETGLVHQILRWSRRLVAAAALTGGVVMLVAGLAGSGPSLGWVLAGLVCAFGALATVPTAVLGGLQRWRGVSLLNLTVGGFSTAGVIGSLAAGGGIVGLFAVEAVSTAALLGISSLLAHRALAALDPPAPRDPLLDARIRHMAKLASLNIVIDFVVWRRSEFLFLDHYSADAQIALYSIAFAAVTALYQLPLAVAGVTSPAFATLYGGGELDRMRRGYWRTLRLLLVLSLPLTALAVTLGPAALNLAYGRVYEDSGPLLIIMVSSLPLLSLNSISRALCGAVGRQRPLVFISAGGALTAIVLDLLLIPHHDALGAAIANATAQVVVTLPVVIFCALVVGRPAQFNTARIARTVVASGLMALAAIATLSAVGGLPGLVLATAAGLVAFWLAASTLKVLSGPDARWLADVLGARAGIRARRAVLALGASA